MPGSPTDEAPAREGGSPARRALRRFVVAPFWAGLLGAGVCLSGLGVIIVLQDDHIVSSSIAGVLAVLWTLVATGVALVRGYTTLPRSYLALVGRLVGGLAFGVAAIAFIAGWAFNALFEGRYPHTRDAALSLAGVPVAAIAIARLHGRPVVAALRASRATRWGAAGAAAVIALGLAWSLDARIRCGLGSGDGCHLAAERALSAGDAARGLALAEQGCALDQGAACSLAGQALWRGSRAPPDRDRAEGLLRSGCVLGDDASCTDLHGLQLTRRCEGYSASACRELAGAYRVGLGVAYDTGAATRSMRQACLLGDVEACGGR